MTVLVCTDCKRQFKFGPTPEVTGGYLCVECLEKLYRRLQGEKT